MVAQLVTEFDSDQTWEYTRWLKDSVGFTVGRDKVLTWGCVGWSGEVAGKVGDSCQGHIVVFSKKS